MGFSSNCTASLRLRALVVMLAILVGPAVAFACATYPPLAYEACRLGNVIDPDTNLPYNCAANNAQAVLNCIACSYTYCVANTFWCRQTCVNQSAVICTSGNGCKLPVAQVVIKELVVVEG